MKKEADNVYCVQATASSDPATMIREGAAALGVALDPDQAAHLAELARQIIEKNRKVNLTGARDLDTLIADHVLDSLALAPLCREAMATSASARRLLVDIGSGGGFPALPLAMALEAIDCVCIESVGKKARALAGLCATVQLEYVVVLNDRAENVAHNAKWREKADFATARAVGSLATVCELSLPFLRVGGVLFAQRGLDAREELNNADTALALLGGRAARVVEVDPHRANRKRTIAVIEKIAPTPARYPRRAGIPAKRPLGEKRR
ncbi:16S rRNA (guanine(527)-N(7))-methyltransferase RsmG [Candidatus Sumerlaeota bacterium]|nr:16S rRNA (guanine(527)-N(7))-methyltransferase RsmG [Candidatus Sumerlaeota bacterium]